MPFTVNPLRRLIAAVLLLCPLSSFVDINGDGVSDLVSLRQIH